MLQRRLRKASETLLMVMMSVMMCITPVSIVHGEEAMNETDQKTPREGNIMVAVSGTRYVADEDDVLQAINLIRYTACRENDPVVDMNSKNGNLYPDSEKTLKLDNDYGENPTAEQLSKSNGDYVPLKWSNALLNLTGIRMGEVAIWRNHERPNNKEEHCFVLADYISNEDLAYSDSRDDSLINLKDALKSFAGERKRYLAKATENIGHYASMIYMKNVYCGMSGFYYDQDALGDAPGNYAVRSCLLLSHGGISNEEAKIKDGQATQKVEVRNTSVTKISTKDDKDIQLDTENNKEKTVSTIASIYDPRGESTSSWPVLDGLSWTSSDEKVAKVEEGAITAVAAGKATITASVNDQSVNFNVTVTGEKKDTDEPKDTSDQKDTGDQKDTDDQNTCKHENTYTDDKEATCTEDGYKNRVICEDCGKVIDEGKTISKLGHKKGEDYKIIEEATCTKEGLKEYYCERCGELIEDFKETIPMIDHDWSDWEDLGNGTHKRTCYTCDKEEIKEHSWKYIDKTKNVHKRECTDCGASGVEKHTFKDGVCTLCGCKEASEHHYGEWKDTKDGKNHIRSCKDDGCEATETKAHDFGEWKRYDADREYAECETCGARKYQKHSFGDWQSITSEAKEKYSELSNYIDVTSYHFRACDQCGAIEVEGHNYGEWSHNEETDHDERTCKDCGYVQSMSYHNYVYTKKDDDKHIGKCRYCGKEVEDTHHWSVRKSDDEYDYMYCYSCDATKTAKHSYSTNYSSDETKHFHYCINGCGRKLDEEDHDWTDWTTSGNYKYRSCKICYRYESQYLDGSDEHHWSDWEAEDDYNEVRKCTDEGCDAIQRRSHSYGDYEDTDDGHKRTCKTCGRVSTTGHNYSQGVDLGNGKHERTCSICGKKIQEQHYISYQDLGDKHIGYCYGCDKTVEEEDHEPTYYSVFSPYLYSNSSSKYHEKHCAKCGHVYSDTKEKHTFSNYVINDYSHSRSCTKCGYNESHEHRLSDYKAEGAKYHYRECEDCGYKNINTHSWTDWEVNDDGTYTRECTVCGYKMTSQHPWNDYFVKTDDKTHTCGTVDSDDAETLTEDHVWGPWNNGMTEHYRTCIICGAREQEKHQLGDAKSDSYNNNYQHYRICSVCGNRVYELHEYGKWIKLDDGMYSHTCKDCGFKETVKHKFGDWKDNGNGKHVRTCTIDGCEEKEEADHNYYYSWIWKYSHDTNDQYDTKDQYDSNDQYDSGDEYTEGVDKENHNVYCFRCGYHTTEPHDWSEDWASNEEGHYHYCTKCILQETIEEHTYGEWKKNKDDEYERSCSVCGYTQTVDHLLGDPVDNGNGTHTRKSLIPGDDYSETEKHTAEYDSGKDLDNGTHQAKCECGAVLIESHDYGDWDYNNTNHYRNCRICDHEESGAHDFSEWQDDGEGSFYKECKTCGYKVTGKHMWSDWKKVDDKTCQRTCEGCGKKQRKLHKSYGVDESINDEMHYDICENCGEKYPVKHTFAYSSYDSKTHYKYCTQCDYEAKNTEAHTWGDWQEVSGNKYRYCTKCGYGQSYEESLHHFDEGKVTKYSTCSTQGTKVYKCTDEGCNETKEEKLPLDPSNHEKVIEDYHKKDATCTEDGYSGDTYCEACGTTITKGSIIKATGHTLDEGKVTKAATCTKKGETTYTCSTCHKTFVKDDIPVDPENHPEDSLEVRDQKEATCTKEGYTGDTYCKDCGVLVKKGATLNAKGHTYSKEPVWNEKDQMFERTCDVCGEVEKTSHIHQFGEAKVTKEPTCVSEGTKTSYCTVCKQEKVEIIPVDPTKHGETKIENYVAATCTKEGYSGDKICQLCHTVIKKGEVTKATGHHVETWTYNKETGKEEGTCTICNEKQTRDHEHTLDAGTVTKDATCVTKGETTYTCTVCGEKVVKDDVAINPNNHTNVQLVNVKEATESEEGYTGDRVCADCQTTISKGSVIAKKASTNQPTNPAKPEQPTTPTQPTTPATPAQPATSTPAQPATSTPTAPATTEKTTAEKVDEGTKAVTSRITSRGNDKDPSGSTYKLLQLKQASASKSSIKVKWNRVSGTNVYLVYTGKCGSKYKFVKSVKGLSYTSKKLNKGTYYKLLVVALNSEGQTIATSKVIHITTKGSKTGNIKKIKLNKKSITLKKKKSYKLKAKVTKDSKKIKTHRGVTYESANPKIATVSKSGKITAKKKGKTTIYAYAQNGVSAKVIVKVK